MRGRAVETPEPRMTNSEAVGEGQGSGSAGRGGGEDIFRDGANVVRDGGVRKKEGVKNVDAKAGARIMERAPGDRFDAERRGE